jgi:hypothetical protein
VKPQGLELAEVLAAGAYAIPSFGRVCKGSLVVTICVQPKVQARFIEDSKDWVSNLDAVERYL